MNNAHSSASAADAATNFRMVHRVKIAPFSPITSPSFGIYPRKKWSHVLLLPFLTERYDASEWMSRIISDAQKSIIASGLDAI